MIVEGFNANDIKPSNRVGLHPQLLTYEADQFDGSDVGANYIHSGVMQTFARGSPFATSGTPATSRSSTPATVTATPIEFGATNLISSDRIEHASKGAIGALIIEPAGDLDRGLHLRRHHPQPGCTRASARVINRRRLLPRTPSSANSSSSSRTTSTCGSAASPTTRSRTPNGTTCTPAIPITARRSKTLAGEDDAEDTGQKAINYRTEPLWKRMQHSLRHAFHRRPATSPTGGTCSPTARSATAGAAADGAGSDPGPGQRGHATRFRVLQPGGHPRNEVFSAPRPPWDKEPYVAGFHPHRPQRLLLLGGRPLRPWPHQPLRRRPPQRRRRQVQHHRRLPLPRRAPEAASTTACGASCGSSRRA